MSHLKSPEVVEGVKRKVVSQDDETLLVLQDIRMQLKILNLHMSLINDVQIENGDIDE
jgi:hypothetical protein